MKALIQGVATQAFRSRLLAKMLFGLDFGPLGLHDYYFDVTTPVLIKRSTRDLTRANRVLDMGTGSVAVIGLSVWKRVGCHVVSCDIDPNIVTRAAESVRRNGAPIRVVRSRFFDGIDDAFDVVIFNPPYVPTSDGLARERSATRRSQWDGGSDGTTVILDFLLAFQDVDRQVTAYMGVNHWHVAREKLMSLLSAQEHIIVSDVYRHSLLPVDVYVLTRKADAT